MAWGTKSPAVRFDEAKFREGSHLADVVDLYSGLPVTVLADAVLRLMEEPAAELLPEPVIPAMPRIAAPLFSAMLLAVAG